MSREPFSAYVNHCNLRGGPKREVRDGINYLFGTLYWGRQSFKISFKNWDRGTSWVQLVPNLPDWFEILKSVHRLLESSQGADQGSSCFSPSGDTCEAAQQEDCYLYGVVRWFFLKKFNNCPLYYLFCSPWVGIHTWTKLILHSCWFGDIFHHR